MFETLEEISEKSKPPLDRGYPILTYSIHLILSSSVLILGVRGHSFSHLLGLVVWAAMFLLSLTWLTISLRSSTPVTRYDYRVRYTTLWALLLLAGGLTDILRGRFSPCMCPQGQPTQAVFGSP